MNEKKTDIQSFSSYTYVVAANKYIYVVPPMKLKYYRISANRAIYIAVAPNGKVMQACSEHNLELIVNCHCALYVKVFGKFTSIKEDKWNIVWHNSTSRSQVITVVDEKYFQSVKKNIAY